jgi:hypothetical protein
MTRRTQLTSLLAAGGALLVSGIAQAQPGGPPGSPGAPSAGAPGAPGGTTDTGAVTNATDTTTVTVTDTDPAVAAVGAEETSTMPNTGGAPLLMALAGSLTAGSALLLRRKLN